MYCTVLYCTVLYCTVLYCTILYCTVLEQIRKFAHREQAENRQSNKQTENSKTEATLILCGSSGERANIDKCRNSVKTTINSLLNKHGNIFQSIKWSWSHQRLMIIYKLYAFFLTKMKRFKKNNQQRLTYGSWFSPLWKVSNFLM